ncbi:hypothetical protein ACJX0J_021467 [Zea mays]
MTAWSKREHPIHLGIYVCFVWFMPTSVVSSFMIVNPGHVVGYYSSDFHTIALSTKEGVKEAICKLNDAVYLAKDEKACTRSAVLDGYRLYMLNLLCYEDWHKRPN